MKMIYTEHGVVGRIAGLLGVSSAFVTMALKYKRDSPLAKRIRHMAIKDFKGLEIDTNNK